MLVGCGAIFGPGMPRKGRPQTGTASWYGKKYHGRKTANGEIFDMYELTAAHRKLPLVTIVKVTNLKNGKSVVVRVNDRGPYVRGRIIDLSYAAAEKIDMLKDGITKVKIEIMD
jgi:rare lipoprotein A